MFMVAQRRGCWKRRDGDANAPTIAHGDNAADHKAWRGTAPPSTRLEVRVKTDAIDFVVNGTVAPLRSQVIPPQRPERRRASIRNHLLEVHVDGFAVSSSTS